MIFYVFAIPGAQTRGVDLHAGQRLLLRSSTERAGLEARPVHTPLSVVAHAPASEEHGPVPPR